MANILVTGSKGQLGTELRKTGFTLLDEVFYTDPVSYTHLTLPTILRV